MRKVCHLMLLCFPLYANSTDNLDTINKLTDKICGDRFDKEKEDCENWVNAVVSLSIYSGYASGACAPKSEYYNQYNPVCKKVQEDTKTLLEKYINILEDDNEEKPDVG